MEEFVLSFLPEQFSTPEIFRIELAGITYPFPTYRVHRPNSHVYSLEYLIGGKGEIQIDGKSYFPEQGDVYLLPQHHDHTYWSSKERPMHKIWLNVSGSLCEQLFKTYHVLNQPVFQKVNMENQFMELLTVCKQLNLTDVERTERTTLLFHKLVLTLYEQSTRQLMSPIPEPVRQAKAFFENHLTSKVSMSDVARSVNLSSSQLTRQFKGVVGQTPYDYFLSKKLEMAQLLLVETRLSIQEISDRLAFSDEHYFSNLFKQKLGLSPSNWRKKGGVSGC